MMATEEAFLLGQAIRSLDPKAVLVLGAVPTTGNNEVFTDPRNGKQTFVIQAEKVPNSAGVKHVLSRLGGATAMFAEFVKSSKPEMQKLKGGWIVGGYHSAWVPTDSANWPAPFKKSYKIVQDVLPSSLASSADIMLPGALWAEKSGSWQNHAGIVQLFEAAVQPPDGVKRDGEVYLKILGKAGRYDAAAIRDEIGDPFDGVKAPVAATPSPSFEFVEL
jgi:NADH-quinone oxidoreductase subunit G